MPKREKKLDLVVKFLIHKKNELIEIIKEEKGKVQEAIELKNQISDAIINLEFLERHNLYANQVNVLKIPEGGSESYFTEFNIVDESGLENVPDWAIKKNERGEIKLTCFDLIIQSKI